MKIKYVGVAVLLMLFIVLGGCTGKPAETTEKKETPPTPVQVDQVKTGVVSSEAGITGKLAPSKEVKIAPKSGGKIKEINAKLGQYVKQGAVLFTLDETDLINAVHQAQAAYDVASASLNQSKTSSDQGLEQAKNSLLQAQKSLEDAKKNEQRTTQLYREGAVSQQQYEQAALALTNAQSAYDNAKQTLEASQKMAGVGVSEASVNQSRVTLENAKEQLANAVVKAPISGYISQVSGEAGEMVSPQQPVVTVVVTDPLLVKANLAEQEITKVKVGTKVGIQITALNKEVEATVTAVSPVMDSSLRAYPIEISIPNPNQELKADMVASVNWKNGIEAENKTLVVPRRAVFDENGKRYVYRIADNVAKKVEIEAGEESSDLTEVKSGLAEGDTVVVRGQTLLKDGSAVQIQNAGD